MLSAELQNLIAGLLGEHAGSVAALSWNRLGSGVGGERWRVSCDVNNWFVKVVDDAERIAAEAEGLGALTQCGAVKIPAVIGQLYTDTQACLVMEWLNWGYANSSAAARLGARLALQHRHASSRFGWPAANFIGGTRQFNTPSNDWIGFFGERRLGFQLRLAAENGYHGELQRLGAQLLEKLPQFFDGYQPQPALLHGDLWGGNWGVLENGEPAIFDPAAYYGDREADLAMTELFGGFPPEFYAAYDASWPRDPGYAQRRDLYNLYHVLNHLNLFGSGYLLQAERILSRLLALTH